MNFYENLKELCLLKKTTLTETAKNLGLSTAMPTNWKKGQIPNGETLKKIADYFDISTDYLLGRGNYSNIEGNGNVVQQGSIHNSPVTIGDADAALTEQEREILRIYNTLSPREKAELFLKVCEYDKK